MNIGTISQQSTMNPCPTQNDTRSTKDRIIDMICNNPNLPTMGSSLSRIVQISSSEDESTEQLANLILADVALTQKIIRLANSVIFRSPTTQVVTNVSRAIQLLGLDMIKTSALAMTLIDSIPGKHEKYVRQELALALTASLIGRQLAKHSYFPNAEEASIAALFKNMGRLLLATYDHNLYKKTMSLVEQGTHTKTQASLQIIGCSFDTLTEIAMRKWLIPESIIRAMKLISTKTLVSPKSRQEWMQQVAEFSESSAELIYRQDESKENTLDKILLKRFGTALNLDKEKLDTLIFQAAEETRMLSNQAHLQPLTRITDIDSDDVDSISNSDKDNLPKIECHPSGKPYKALDQLLIGAQDVAILTATKQYKINELILTILEILYKSLGFSLASMILKDIKTNQYRVCYSFGKNSIELQRSFIFSDAASSDIFSLSINKNVDLTISDSKDIKMRNMLPNWHSQLFPDTRSFVILPLVIENKPLGLFYLDRQQEAPEGFSSDEMRVIKALKKHLLTALSSQ